MSTSTPINLASKHTAANDAQGIAHQRPSPRDAAAPAPPPRMPPKTAPSTQELSSTPPPTLGDGSSYRSGYDGRLIPQQGTFSSTLHISTNISSMLVIVSRNIFFSISIAELFVVSVSPTSKAWTTSKRGC